MLLQAENKTPQSLISPAAFMIQISEISLENLKAWECGSDYAEMG